MPTTWPCIPPACGILNIDFCLALRVYLNAVRSNDGGNAAVEVDAVFLQVDAVRLTQAPLLLQRSPLADTTPHEQDPNHHQNYYEYIHVIRAQHPKQSGHDSKAEA
jgi:hypothetical protein